MSIENALRDMVRREIEAQLTPLNKAVNRMAQGLGALDMLRAVTQRLAPLSSRLGAVAGVRTPPLAPPAATKARRGRPPAALVSKPAPAAKPAAKPAPVAKPVVRTRSSTEGGERACAVIGCKRPSRSKGYCSAHYQKLRLLIRTGRRPSDWVDDASPQSARELKLPRGRAASQALKETPSKPSAPAVPPKPKAWVRRKGVSGMVSLT